MSASLASPERIRPYCALRSWSARSRSPSRRGSVVGAAVSQYELSGSAARAASRSIDSNALGGGSESSSSGGGRAPSSGGAAGGAGRGGRGGGGAGGGG